MDFAIRDLQRDPSQTFQEFNDGLPVFGWEREKGIARFGGFTAVEDNGLLRIAAAAVVQELMEAKAQAQSGGVRYSPGCATPSDTPSLSVAPMSCRRKSE